uniref:N-acetyltransferase ESCO zinc-finger domain-containing protein n=1 Tax=Romanomermis culicivorax TaxID=13658 RepID=A0A915K129_ROMCU
KQNPKYITEKTKKNSARIELKELEDKRRKFNEVAKAKKFLFNLIMATQKTLFCFVNSKMSQSAELSNTSTNTLPYLPKTSTSNNVRQRSKRSKLDDDENQLILDAGQKKFGPQYCSVCDMIYDPTFRPDVRAHDHHHKFFLKKMLSDDEDMNQRSHKRDLKRENRKLVKTDQKTLMDFMILKTNQNS